MRWLPSFSSTNHKFNFWHYLPIILAIIGFSALQLYHFDGYNYRQDEAWMIHVVFIEDLFGLLKVLTVSPSLPLYLIILDIWVALFGHHELVTRFLSLLFAVISLSLTYRLTKDDTNHRTALVSVIILGTLNFVLFYTHETRPYSLFMMLGIAMLLVVNRWFKHPSFKRGFLVVLLGVAGIYTHYYFVIYMGALTFSIALLRPWYRRQYWGIIGLFALIGIFFIPQAWIVYNNTISADGGIGYALNPNDIPSALRVIYDNMRTNPQVIGIFLLLLAIANLLLSRKWFSKEDRNQQLSHAKYILIPVFILVLSLIANKISPSLTTRNIIIIMPPLAILAALGTIKLSHYAVWILMGLLIALPPFQFTPMVSNGPYAEVADFIDEHYEEGGHILVDAIHKWQHAPLLYYLQLRTDHQFSQAVMTNFGIFTPEGGLLAEEPQNLIAQSGIVAPFLSDEPEQIFWIQVIGAGVLSQATRDAMADNYIAYREVEFDWDWYHRVVEYRRIPDDLEPIIIMEDDITFEDWELSEFIVQPCESIELDSWWRTKEILPTNYSMTFVLADENGNGIVNTDGSPANTLTQLWTPNRPYLDERTLTIPCDLASGSYPLLLGWYDIETVELLDMADTSGNPINNLFYLTNVTVE